MNRIIGAVFVVFLLSTTAFAASTKITTNDNLINEQLRGLNASTDVNATNTSVLFTMIYGPIRKQYTSIDIVLNSDNAKKVNRFVNGLLPRFIRVRDWIPVLVSNLTFTVEFKQNVSNTSKFNYLSYIVNMTYNETGVPVENETLVQDICTTHTIKVENFTGVFMFMPYELINIRKAPGYRFNNPAKFAFIGICDNYNYTKDPIKPL